MSVLYLIDWYKTSMSVLHLIDGYKTFLSVLYLIDGYNIDNVLYDKMINHTNQLSTAS